MSLLMLNGHTRFNPRAPCGARPIAHLAAQIAQQFQSTCPVWGTTLYRLAEKEARNVSIHVPRVGHDALLPSACRGKRVSIHVPRVGHNVSDFSDCVCI